MYSMMKFFFAGLFILAACVQKKPEPKLSPEQMAEILAEFYYMEAAMEPLSLHVRDSIIQARRWEILESHHCTDEDFLQASAFYKSDKEKMKLIEQSVMDRLEEKINTKTE